jgi:LysM repeat protein
MAAIAVTISLHPAAAHQAPAQHTVKSGDTLPE